jgi:hypothetical protein
MPVSQCVRSMLSLVVTQSEISAVAPRFRQVAARFSGSTRASISATMSAIDQSRVAIPAAIAGNVRSVL